MKDLKIYLFAFLVGVLMIACEEEAPMSSCSDGIQNGTEQGVDCGGDCTACITLGCTDPIAHNYDSDADTDDGSCETCTDGILNGDESRVDCGGSCPNICTYINEVNLPGSQFLGGSILCSDNNIVIYGIGFVIGNVFISKIDRFGEVLWDYTSDESIRLTGLVESPEGDYVAIGESDSGQTVVTKISSDGELIWTREIVRFHQGTPIIEKGVSITNAQDDGFILVTDPASFSFPFDLLTDADQLLKIDNNGNLDVSWGGTTQSQSTFSGNRVNIIRSVSNGYVLGLTNGIIIKTDNDGIVEWSKDANTEGPMVEIIELEDGSLVTAGGFGSSSSDASFGLMKRNAEGTEIWTELINGDGSSTAVVNSMNDNLIAVGSSNDNSLIVKFDTNGNELLRSEIDVCSFSNHSVYTESDSGILLVGTSECSNSESKISVLKLNYNGQL